MTDATAIAMLVVLLGVAVYIWSRGLRSGSISDLILGPAIPLFLCGSAFLQGGHQVINIVRVWFILFGLASGSLRFLTSAKCPLSRRDVTAVGAGFAIAGFCMALII